MECSLNNAVHHVPYLISSFGLLFATDLFLFWTNMRESARWYKLHLVANFVTCLFSAYDFVRVWANPIASDFEGSLVPANIIFALHFYHMFMFNDLVAIDWIHHSVMMFLLNFTFWCYHPIITNMILFMTSGLPGGIDYLLLICYKAGYIRKITEKQINSMLNVWIRSPGILISTYIVYIQKYYGIIHFSWWVVWVIIAGLYWNAQYFTKRVVYNWGSQSETD